MELQAIRRAARTRTDAEPMRPASAPSFADNRPATATMRSLTEAVNASPRIAAQRKLADTLNARTSGALQRKPLSHSASLPVQRVITGNPRGHIHWVAPGTDTARARLRSVTTTLVNALDNDANIQLGALIISVEQEGGQNYTGGASTIAGDNPAETNVIDHGMNPPDIRVTLQRAFAEAATEGELLGMLAHEVGVHTIPTRLRGINDLGTAAFAPITTPRKIAEGNTASGGYEFQNWPVPAHGPPSKRHGPRQHDHVMVSDLLRNPPAPGVAMPLTRANVYFETMLNIGDTVWADPAKSLEERTEQTTELVHLFLVDVARIIATDDGRLAPARHARAVDDVYGEVFNQVVLPYRGAAHPWIPAARPKGNVYSLGASLAAFVGKVKLEKALFD